MTATPEIETATYRRAERLLARRCGDRLILLSPATGELLELNGSGLALWEALAAPCSPEHVARDLARAFDTSTDVVLRDIEPVLDELVARGALERVGLKR